MRHILLTLLIGIGMTFPAFARLGETEAQCIARYGDEIINTDAGKARSAEFIKDDTLLWLAFCRAYPCARRTKRRA